MKNTLNIVNVARRFVREEWGGAETAILETSRCLMQRGHMCEIYCSNALADRESDVMDGVPIQRAPYFYPYLGLGLEAKASLDRKGGNLFSLTLLRQLMKRPELDLIHAHTGKRLGGIVRHVARKRGIPYVVSLHGGAYDVPDTEAATWTAPTRGAFEWGKALGLWVGSRRVLRDAAAIICFGQREYELTREQYPDQRVVLLPNGVDEVSFAKGDGRRFRSAYAIPDAAELITVVGRFDVQKNQKLAVRALAQIAEIRPHAFLALIGHVTNATYFKSTEALAKSLGVADRVVLIPGIDPKSRLLKDAYHGSDVLLLPSKHEPFGIVILEAWAAGRPVVASNVGGIPSFVDDGSDGMLFPSNDLPLLVDALIKVLPDSALRNRLAANGRKKVADQFTWNSITDQILDLYQEVLS